MKNISIVQFVIYAVAIVAIGSAVIMFTLYRGKSSTNEVGTVVLWGTVPQEKFDQFVIELQQATEGVPDIMYTYKDPGTFENELLRALAEGIGPDLVMLNEKQIITNRNRMQEIPYSSFPLRDFQERFLDEASLLTTQTGILGFPIIVDPLVMYYHKDMLANAGYVRPPTTWSEMLAIVPSLTQKDSSFNITKSAIALGSYSNITHAKDIFWALTLQAGNPVIERYQESDTGKEYYRSIFSENLGYTLNPSYAAVNFFTQFANPTKTVYSWNRSLPESQTAFAAGDLAFYFGFASEMPTLRRINPNLNFDVTLIPQSQSSTRQATYGRMTILTIPKASQNIAGAVQIMGILSSRSAQELLGDILGTVSVRRDLLAVADASSSYETIFNRSAIIAQGILEPTPSVGDTVIQELIETVVSGQYEISVAIGRAQEKLMNALR